MTHSETILAMTTELNGMITATQVTQAGIPRYALTKLVNRGALCRADRGVYVLPDVWEDELFILQYKYGQGIFSHDTALYLHGLIDRTPHQYTMTFPIGYNPAAAKAGGLATRLVKAENHELGKIMIDSPCKHKIAVYDVERTLCDIVKPNSTSDIQIVNGAMRAYVQQSDINMTRLYQYADQLRVTDSIARYMEVLL
ncbi:type IV toxin-antitoxin system AbiEi family antitoxin domain-containing protein [Bengtsoniella intestinalis]|uniref:type IV toxin-antitoxin system AbiEi family antitoxin domain-containing protein n=1 Tax=Bengtsoniella intestinalis TaxID=3073143 RepID=UPI00391EEBCE